MDAPVVNDLLKDGDRDKRWPVKGCSSDQLSTISSVAENTDKD
jgi:hypothetical protein